MADNEQMVMAGLWAKWKSPTSGEEVLSCTILTCGPNKSMGELHDRMPVVLAENDWPKWLGEEPASEQELLALLRPCQDEVLKIWPVDRMVGNVKNNGPQLVLFTSLIAPGTQQLRQLRHVYSNPSRLVVREQLGR